MTSAPSARARRAVSSPMPALPPISTTVWPSNSGSRWMTTGVVVLVMIPPIGDAGFSLRMREVRPARGLGNGSLYGAFGDKHGLFLRVLDDYLAATLETVRQPLRDPNGAAYDRLARHIRAQTKAIAADE